MLIDLASTKLDLRQVTGYRESTRDRFFALFGAHGGIMLPIVSEKLLCPKSESQVRLWIDSEGAFRRNLYDGVAAKDIVRVTGDKSSRIVFTAPHAVNHRRSGAVKHADLSTGGLAEALAITTRNCAVTVAGPSSGDSNWDSGVDPFKARLISFLSPGQFVIDLHGMKNDHGVDINIGLGRFPAVVPESAINSLRETFTDAGLNVSINVPFDASRSTTITSFVQSHGIPAVQIEISARFRRPAERIDTAAVLLDAFVSAVDRL